MIQQINQSITVSKKQQMVADHPQLANYPLQAIADHIGMTDHCQQIISDQTQLLADRLQLINDHLQIEADHKQMNTDQLQLSYYQSYALLLAGADLKSVPSNTYPSFETRGRMYVVCNDKLN